MVLLITTKLTNYTLIMPMLNACDISYSCRNLEYHNIFVDYNNKYDRWKYINNWYFA